ncbi:MAG: MobA/MobL family protein [Lachnospiraceae bacterium]|nr:MobA/MobL family protein [Lachnospiraceae bacterium]
MAIYHLEAKVVSRGTGRSAVAAAAYMSCSQILNDYDGVQHDYTRKQGLVWQQIFLPEHAPAEWQDRSVLWNAVEENEKTKDSRLAREFVVALPIELKQPEWQELLTEFVQDQFVSDGMCADVCIHDTDGHNPHAHIMLTVRPLDEQGKWQYKTEKEYLCVRKGEERGFTSSEFKTAQADGWEKQYQYKVGKKKVYMPPSAAEAQGYERVSKYPKSTKYGRQNPISARWNSDEQLVLWREAWADTVNQSLERSGMEERIDHRSHAARGLDEQPTVHEGVIARAMERKGIVADRCELNRQIKADNVLLRELKSLVQKLMDAVKNTIPVIAEAMETVRQKMIIFRYHLLHIKSGKTQINNTLQVVQPDIKRYENIVKRLKVKVRERQVLLEEKKTIPAIHIFRHRELSQKIAALTEEIEELKSEKALLLNQVGCADDHGMAEVKQRVASMESSLEKLNQREKKYTAELDAALVQYAELQRQTTDIDTMELDMVCQAIRPNRERETVQQLQTAYGKRFDSGMLAQSGKDVAHMLDEAAEPVSIHQKLRQSYEQQNKRHPTKDYNQER